MKSAFIVVSPTIFVSCALLFISTPPRLPHSPLVLYNPVPRVPLTRDGEWQWSQDWGGGSSGGGWTEDAAEWWGDWPAGGGARVGGTEGRRGARMPRGWTRIRTDTEWVRTRFCSGRGPLSDPIPSRSPPSPPPEGRSLSDTRHPASGIRDSPPLTCGLA